jgi:MoaA/NifB/PqqE/SkfB family radical SAM enzyme
MIDFARSPFIVIWEVTRAGTPACAHCQAEAIPRRNPGELRFGDIAAFWPSRQTS